MKLLVGLHTERMHLQFVYGWYIDGTVTVASMDTLTEGGRQGVHPWMVHGWHSNCDIHRYFDRRWQPRCPSMDGPWMAQ